MKYLISCLFVLIFVKLYPQSAASPVSGIQVVMACADSLTLGYIPGKGNETRKLAAQVKNKRCLDSLVSARYAGRFNVAGKRLLWLVRDLSVTTDAEGQYYFARLKADVYLLSAGAAFQRSFSADTILAGKMVDNNSYTTGITQVLDGLFDVSIAQLKNGEQTGTPSAVQATAQNGLTEKAILSQALEQTTWPVLKEQTIRPGAYATFNELLNNAPSITQPVWADPDAAAGAGHVKLFTMGQDSIRQQLTAVWGVCFGGTELYKYEKGLLIPIERSGNELILSRYQEPVQRKNQAMYWRHIASFGWPGDTNPFARTQMIQLDKLQGAVAAQQPIATRIDMTTGALSF